MSKIEWRVDGNTHVVVRNSPFLRRKVELNGQRVDGKWSSKSFPFLLPDGRAAAIQLKADALSRTTELTVDGKVIPDTRYVPQDLRCPACNAEIQLLDEYCARCGHALGAPDRFIGHRSVQSASTAIRVLAVMYAVFGLAMFAATSNTTNEALQHLSQFEDDEELQPIDGVTYTAGELRAQVQWEHRGILIVNLILSALMLVLAWWSKRKPLPAILIATAIFVTVHVVSAIVDPKTIMQGVLLKIIIIGVLIKGIKGAFSLRTDHG